MNLMKSKVKGFQRFGVSIILTIIILMTGMASAQDFQETVQQLPQDPAKEFARPLTDAFGANINTGWLNNAPKATRMGLDFKIGLVAMGAFIDKDAAIFVLLNTLFPFQGSEATQIANTIPGFGSLPAETQQEILRHIAYTGLEADVDGPTFFGSKDENVVVSVREQQINIDGTDYTVPSQEIPLDEIRGILQDPGIFPLIAPQLSIGTLYGTQATLRYIPKTRFVDELGKVEYIAAGLQHNPLVWFSNPMPVDFSAAFFYQQINIENTAKIKSTAFGINVSKTIGGFIAGFTPYAGFMYEESKMNIDYEYIIDPSLPPIEFKFDIEGANKTRFILGFSVTLVGLNIYADYNFSKVNTLNLSVLYGF